MINMVCSCKKRPSIDPRDYLFEDLHKSKPMKPYIPTAFSLKDKFPPVYNQGQTGTCTSCAVLACDDYYYHDKPAWLPSWIFTYYNQKKMNHDMKADDGSCVEFALKAVRKFGACNSKVWSNDEAWNKKPSDEAYANGLKGHEITTYHRLKNLSQLKQAISNGYPVPASVTWAFRDYDENYILNKPTQKEIDKCEDGHAIVVVGYDDATQLIEIRNSWSNLWGNEGYAYMTYNTFKMVVDYSDTYAVVK